MQDALQNSCPMWWKLHKAGEQGDFGDSTWQRMLETRMTLRKDQRLEAAIQRNDRVTHVMTSDDSSISSTDNVNPPMRSCKLLV